MKIYKVVFNTPKDYNSVREVAKSTSPGCKVDVNMDTKVEGGYKEFKLDNREAAVAIGDHFNGTLTVIDVDMKNILR